MSMHRFVYATSFGGGATAATGVETTARSVAASAGATRGTKVSLPAAAVAAFKRWHRYRRTLAELGRLDDRTLRDIGLHRDQIRATARDLADRPWA